MIEGKSYSNTRVKFGPVDAGDKVTTLLAVTDAETGDLATYVVRTTVATAFMPDGFRWGSGHGRIGKGVTITVNGVCCDRLFADEHLTWIRGWPAWDSPEVQALLVADAMGPGAMPEHELAHLDSGDCLSTGYTFDLGLQR